MICTNCAKLAFNTCLSNHCKYCDSILEFKESKICNDCSDLRKECNICCKKILTAIDIARLSGKCLNCD
jgi:hypothetical protein